MRIDGDRLLDPVDGVRHRPADIPRSHDEYLPS